MEYPKYVSHKHVSAAKIAAVDPGADGSLTVHLEGDFANVVIPHHELKNKPKPEAGWYLVRYEDGYLSFSPASTFEQGYSSVTDEAPFVGNMAPAFIDETPTVIEQDEDDEDEEVADAANNHGQAAAAE